jgi:N utilization substance protein A
MKGSRVQNVVQELRGEKIDIIPWHVDPAKFVCNALAPAEISRVIIDETNQTMEVIVPDDFLSIAIGKKGQNVRLASKLTGWNLDVKSETKYTIAMQSGYDSLVALPGVGISLADALYELGFYSAEEVSNATPEDLIQIRGIGEETAKKLIAAAQTAVEEAEQAEELEEETSSKTSETAETAASEGNGVDTAAETSSKADQRAEEMEETGAEAVSQNDGGEAQTTQEEAPEQQAASADIEQPSEDTPEMSETDSAATTGDDTNNAETNTEKGSSTT